MRRLRGSEQPVRADDCHVLHSRRLRVPLLEAFQEFRVRGKHAQRVLLTGLKLQECKKRDAVAEPGHGVPHVRLRPVERLEDLFSGCLRVGDVLIVLDVTVMNPALPSAQHALGFTNADRQWIRASRACVIAR